MTISKLTLKIHSKLTQNLLKNHPFPQDFSQNLLKILLIKLKTPFRTFWGRQQMRVKLSKNLYVPFRWKIFSSGQNRKIPTGSDMVIFTRHQHKRPIRPPDLSQCGLSSSLFLPSTIGRYWLCLFCLPVDFL